MRTADSGVAAIRNKAIAASSGDYVIHVDGDLILQRNFIQDHILFAREDCYVSGLPRHHHRDADPEGSSAAKSPRCRR